MNMTAKSRSLATATLDDPRWAAVVARDAKADGQFFYSVRTTGVYCRPSCAARTPRPENVAFHLTAIEAQSAGFRACLRCKPDEPSLATRHAALVAQMCRLLESSEQLPSLAELAQHAQLSTFHLHRVFKGITGLTPKAYAAAHRAKRMREELGRAGTVTDAIYGAGYNSGGRFYAEANNVIGMTPTRYRAGGVDTEIRFAVGQCSLGAILVARSDRGVCAILMGDDPDALARDLQDRFPQATLVGGDVEFEQWVARVIGFVEAPATWFGPAAGRARYGLSATRLEGATDHSTGKDCDLQRHCTAHRCTERDSRRGESLCLQSACCCHPLPPRGAQGRYPLGLQMGCGT